MTTRRKKERKTSKLSPEKKVEKPKRGRPKRRKRSESTPEPESGDECKQTESEVTPEGDTVTAVAKESPPGENQADQDDKQVWQVKTADTSSDTGEIQKLKICLKRPSTTPERIDQSPRSRKKLNRNTSQSDASGTDIDETRRSRHRARKSTRESHDEPLEPVLCEQQVSLSKSEDIVVAEAEDEEDSKHAENTEPNDVSFVQPHIEEKEDQKKSSDDSKIENKEKLEAVEHTEKESKTIDVDSKMEDAPLIETYPVCIEVSKEGALQQSENEKDVEIYKTPEQKASANSDSSESTGISTQTKPSEESNPEKPIASDTDSQKSETKQDISKENTTNDSLEDECTKASSPVNKGNSDESHVMKSENTVDKNEILDLNHCEDELNVVNNKENESPTNDFVEQQKELSKETHHVGESLKEVPARKRRWGKRSSNSKPTLVSISTDSLKDIISDVQPVELDEIMPEKKERRVREEKKERREEKRERREEKKEREKMNRPLMPTYTIENDVGLQSKEKLNDATPNNISAHRKIVLVGEEASAPPLSPSRHSISSVLHISNLVRPFTLPQLKNLLQRTGKIVDGGFWIDGIKSKCYVQYETEDQATETRHALHGVTWPMSNPKTLNVDFASEQALDAAKRSEDAPAVGGGPQTGKAPVPDAVKPEYGWDINSKNDRSTDNHWERKKVVREWDVGKTEKDKERIPERRKPHSPQHSPARKFKKTEEEPAPAKMLDDLFKKTKTTPYIYWLPLTAETIAVKEEQRRQHMAEHERRLLQHRREPRVRR